MSARENLIRSVYSTLSQNQMEELVDDYAHELAEKQRAFDGPSMTMAGNTMVPLELITALIDSEVEK